MRYIKGQGVSSLQSRPSIQIDATFHSSLDLCDPQIIIAKKTKKNWNILSRGNLHLPVIKRI